MRADVDTGPVNHFLNVNYSEVEPTERRRLLWPSALGLFKSLQSGGVYRCRPSRLADEHADRHEHYRASAWPTPCRSSTSGYRSRSARAGRHDRHLLHEISLTKRRSSTFDESTWSPAYAVVVKPLENVSLYANYIEGLQAGESSSASASPMRGQVFPPYRTKQKEAGVKVDFGRITTTVAAFEITKPSIIMVGDAADWQSGRRTASSAIAAWRSTRSANSPRRSAFWAAWRSSMGRLTKTAGRHQ